jgi:branched-chain amino acid transport system ATP-binding protein
MSLPLLSIQDLHHWFGGLHVISGASLSCGQAAITAIIGPNGAGKTTLFNLVAGTLSPSAGSIIYDGKAIQGLPAYRVAALGISRTFQTTRLFPGMSVLENVMVGRHRRARGGFLSDLGGRPFNGREELRMRRGCMDILESLGIAALADQEARALPFGIQRLVELARALASEPRLLLLDEPACGLNPSETGEMAARISALRDRGIAILIVEHDMSLVMEISDHVVVLSYGSVIAEGTPREIQANEEVVSVYLGAEDALDPECSHA